MKYMATEFEIDFLCDTTIAWHQIGAKKAFLSLTYRRRDWVGVFLRLALPVHCDGGVADFL